jgi:hypothetical protein
MMTVNRSDALRELDPVQQIVIDRLGLLVDQLHREAGLLEARYDIPAQDSREAADVISELRKQVQRGQT